MEEKIKIVEENNESVFSSCDKSFNYYEVIMGKPSIKKLASSFISNIDKEEYEKIIEDISDKLQTEIQQTKEMQQKAKVQQKQKVGKKQIKKYCNKNHLKPVQSAPILEKYEQNIVTIIKSCEKYGLVSKKVIIQNKLNPSSKRVIEDKIYHSSKNQTTPLNTQDQNELSW